MKKKTLSFMSLLLMMSLSMSSCGGFTADDTLQISSVTSSVSEDGTTYFVIYFEDGTIYTQEVPKGETGKAGNGIAKIEKDEKNSTNESNVYIIYFEDGTTSTFTTLNGKGVDKISISSIADDGTIYLKVYYNGDYDGDGLNDESEPFPIPRGYSVLVGDTNPTKEQGKNNDSFINSKNGDMFLKVDDEWQLVGNLRGSYIHFGNGNPDPALGSEGDIYVDTKTYDVYEKTSSGWGSSPKGNLKGNSVYTQSGYPNFNLGKEGDTYIDLETYNIYVKTSEGWGEPIGNIKGQGISGAYINENGELIIVYDTKDENGNFIESEPIEFNCSVWLIGDNGFNVAPGADVGKQFDFYINTDYATYYQIYYKISETSWLKVFEVQHDTTQQYTIKYDLNADDACFVNGGQKLEHIIKFNSYYEAYKYGENISIPYAKRDGYEFGGWYTTREPGVNDGQFTNLTYISCDMTLFAHWIEK